MSANVYMGDEAEKINQSYTPEDTKEIIRYMDFGKFMHLITKKQMYFRNVKEFEDKYEGRLPESFFKHWAESHRDSYKRMFEELDKHRSVFACCWNDFNNKESYALWRIYTNIGTGVAIKTSVKNLRKSLDNKSIKIYSINYIKSFDNMYEELELPFYFDENGGFVRVKEACKHVAYEYENEVRALFIGNHKCSGMNVDVDLSALIEEIYLSPFSEGWFRDLIQEIVSDNKYGISDKPIVTSNIII